MSFARNSTQRENRAHMRCTAFSLFQAIAASTRATRMFQ
jgi:hypothetical protein